MDRLKDVELLYVEDDDETREFVLELFEQYKFPLIITDIKMPIMNGVEMIRRIREDTTVSPLVMVTTAHKEQELHSPLADIHLFKPIDMNHLLETAQDLLIQAGKI